MFTKETSLIIPTRNRPKYLKETLEQLDNQKIKFSEIIIIDSSDKSFEDEINQIIRGKNIKFFKTQPSTSRQRNFGIEKMNSKNKFIMFLDDDIIFSENMFSKMNDTINLNSKYDNIAGYGFNQIQNVNERSVSIFEKLKSNFFFDFFELYPKKPGKIALSGWQSKILNIEKDIYVDWVYTTACIYFTKEINKLRFDENFGNYGYLEDLDFSYNFSKLKKKILISSQSKYFHPLSIDRSNFKFGIYEVRNRYKIVKKYKLSKLRFFIMTLIRTTIFFLSILIFKKKKFMRAIGNIYGILNCYKY